MVHALPHELSLHRYSIVQLDRDLPSDLRAVRSIGQDCRNRIDRLRPLDAEPHVRSARTLPL